MTASATPLSRQTTPQENQRAASHPSSSVWVNASAGSGKTTVLTARVTRLLLAGVSPEKILCLTYTRAGAAEMTNRITALFSKWVSCDEDTLRHDLDALQDEAPTSQQLRDARRLFARVLSCPGGLRIRTIHSFCQEILSRFPIESGLPPHFALIDEQDLDVLKNEILDDLLREAAENPATELAHALSLLIAEQGEHEFTKMLQDALRECGRLPDNAKILTTKLRALVQLEPDDSAEKFRASAMAAIPVDDMRQMAIWLLEDSEKHKARGQKLLDIISLPPSQRTAHFNDYRGLFLTKKDEAFADSSIASKKLRDKNPDILAIATREATRLQSMLERIEAAGIVEITESVLVFGTALAQRLQQAKAARAAVDYDDLIMRTEKLLNQRGIGAWILYKLDNGIDHILVDEAQDTSRAQWNIVQALTQEFYAGAGARENNRTLFVVGDEKQSIFSFQNADPEAFLSLRSFFTQKLSDANKRLEKIGLHTSFRSAPAILHAVDEIFAADSARQGVSIEPVTHTSYKNRDGSDKIGRVEVWPLIKPIKDETDSDGTWVMPTGYEDEHDPQAELAQQIAKKIKNWLVQNETLPGTAQPIKPADIMILLRRRGRFADLMVRALKANNVPVTGIDRMHLIDQLPVMDLLAMVRFVLLPEDDLNLATLLRSPLCGVSEEQLMHLSMGRKTNLWQTLKDAPDFVVIHDYLGARLNEADFTTPFEFLSHILNMPCPANPVSGRKALWARLGDESLDPIEELLNAAQNFTRGHAPSLQNFLHWLVQADAEIKRELDSGDKHGAGQVRIMTVHASKGLEAPIVFLPDTASVPRSTDIPKFQWSGDAPLFLVRKPTFGAASRVWQDARQRQMEEYRRLFYVALTRAANRLYICGWRGRNDGDGSWYQLAASALRPLDQPHLHVENDNAEIIYADAEIKVAAKTQTAEQKPQKITLPDWALQPVPIVTAQLHAASSMATDDFSAATPDIAFARGRIIHRLLQSLPDIALDKRSAAMDRFLSQPRHDLTPEQKDEIAQEVGKLLADGKFAKLFATDSRAEVGLTGTINGVDIFRQVDRLCLVDDEVWIVDYKTNRPPPLVESDIPLSYRQQVSEYRMLLRGIYPDKKVRCFLLWTYAPRLMEVFFDT